MKFLKYALLILAIAIIAFVVLGATQPDDYDVKRTKTVNAPLGMVFNNVNDFKNWEEWGPWYDDDSTIVATYTDKTSGVGAAYSWTSKEGPGNMKTIALKPNTSITQKIQFGDYEPTDVYWTFKETPKGTDVTWGMKADKTPFMFKLFAGLAGGMDNMLGPMLDRGLVKMDSVMQIHKKNSPATNLNQGQFKLGNITEITLPAQKFIGYKYNTTTTEAMKNMTNYFMDALPKAGQYAASKKLNYGEYKPGATYTLWDEENDKAEFFIGLVLKKDIPPAEGMSAINLPAGKTITLTKYGPYGNGDYQAHTKLNEYIAAKKYTIKPGVTTWEIYPNDPAKVKPEAVETAIFYGVK